MKLFWITVAITLLVIISSADAKKKRKFDGDFEFADEDDNRVNNVIPLGKPGEKKRWIHDPDSDLCQPLKCKKKEICLLEDEFTAVCVSKKELHKNGDIVVPKSKFLADQAAAKKKATDDMSTVANDELDEGEDADDVDDDDDDDLDDEDEDDVFYDTETDEESGGNGETSISKCTPCPIVKPMFLCGTNNKTFSSLCRLDYHNCIHQTKIKLACKGFCPCKESEFRLRKKQKQADRAASVFNKYKYTNVPEGGKMANDLKASQDYMNKYMFVPKDFKYDNQHYKYIKYMKHEALNKNIYSNQEMSEDKDKIRGYNDVLDTKPHLMDTCSPSALQAMGDRLLDWFSVIMADAKRRHTHNKGKAARFPPSCRSETRWMFQHLDLNSDAQLSLQELYDLEHDQNERCIKPFLDSCDSNRDIFVTPHEWCHCFEKTDRPCTAVKRRISTDILGAYIPECDSEGYYHHTQCHSSVGLCWCVDKHGVEFPNTRTRGKPNCEKTVAGSNGSQKESDNGNDDSDDDDDEDDDDSDQDTEGSADQPLDF